MKVAVVIVAVACSGPQEQVQQPPPPPVVGAPAPDAAAVGPFKLKFHAWQLELSARRKFGQGETLKSGDKVEFEVELEQPVHLYLVQFFPDGSAAILHSGHSSGTTKVGPFMLDEALGEENVYVVASRRPLEEADRAVRDAVEEIKLSSAGAAEVKKPAVKKKGPGLMTMGNRGLIKIEDKSVVATSDDSGVAIVRFGFVHAAR